MKSKILGYVLLLGTFLFAQPTPELSVGSDEFRITSQVINPSSNINDAEIVISAMGGQPPYYYYWDAASVDTLSNKATGLTEGISHTVRVEDRLGNTSIEKIYVPAESITEHFNGFFVPLVANVSDVLFFDPFAALGLYDPVVYSREEKIAIPDWSVQMQEKYRLAKWYKPEGAHVNEGDLIAMITTESGVSKEVLATNNGILHHLASENEIIYDSDNPHHLIQRGAQNFASIKYDNPIPLLNPNGSVQTTRIPFIVIWLVVGALFFTLRMGFINFRGFRHSLQLASGKYDDPNAPGQVTHFQALATAVSGTVGLGNIAGVAVAISIGGAGATFWMIIAGLLGMSSKFVECSLGVKYRTIKEDGRVFGGPMQYLRKGLEKRGMGGFGKALAVLFAILTVGASFGGGNMFQANQSFEQLADKIPMMQGQGFIYGVITAILVGAVIIGGIRSIAKFTSRIVPLMASIYIIACLIVIGVNIANIGPAFQAIFKGAFSPSALQGGIIGVLIVGFQRAAFSNEAGIGSAAIAHSAAKTNHPTSEGFVALLEPFIDTVVVCTLTALVLIFTGMHEVDGMAGAKLTSDAFGSVISWFPYVLILAVFMFAFSTMISWSYYGMRAWTYLFGTSLRSEMIYKILFLIFVVIGASISLGAVLDFSDMMILAMAFPNIIGLYILSGEVKKDMDDYLQKLKRGELFRKTPK
ncbi:MAG: alanine/glycine:cation symporter family protein [Weeksellaceae bacterium]|nr:alanine/glycine:cation symporter family protein [Weeksellaceae bacterium]